MKKIIQKPTPGSSYLCYQGDCFTIKLITDQKIKGKAFLRTNFNNIEIRHKEIIKYFEEDIPIHSEDWHDIQMTQSQNDSGVYEINIPLTDIGIFQCKAFFIKKNNKKLIWPEGDNIQCKVEPSVSSGQNSMYTVFTRQFGSNKNKKSTTNIQENKELLKNNYQSGKFRDVIKELDFIINTLGFKIIQMLPVHPVPTTYARMGEFGSPFACIDYFDIDPAYACFDKYTTPLQQFKELIDNVHLRSAKIFMDLPINHTGWGAKIQNKFPQWYSRNEDGTFKSPGAWGVTWEDLVKLDYSKRDLWKYIADIFRFWCSAGIDGFRCDAGYKVPLDAWKYIVARVRCDYPDTIFMLEGLGGEIQTTKDLLTDGQLNWAYSEIFQQYSGSEIQNYLPVQFELDNHFGRMINFSETHDNIRLASVSKVFSIHRNNLCALTSISGTFGITNGVEWLADEKIAVHQSNGLNWNSKENISTHLVRINKILQVHPSFYKDSVLSQIHQNNENCIAIKRESIWSEEILLILINCSCESEERVVWNCKDFLFNDNTAYDLLSSKSNHLTVNDDKYIFNLQKGEAKCLTGNKGFVKDVDQFSFKDNPETGFIKFQRAKSIVCRVVTKFLKKDSCPAEKINYYTELLLKSPDNFFKEIFPPDFSLPVILINSPADLKRTVLLPSNKLILIKSKNPFKCLIKDSTKIISSTRSLEISETNSIVLITTDYSCDNNKLLDIVIKEFSQNHINNIKGNLLYIGNPDEIKIPSEITRNNIRKEFDYALCANNRGSYSQVYCAWSHLRSKYDAFFACNLNDSYPTDRQIFLRRFRIWLIYKDYSHEVSFNSQLHFSTSKNIAQWSFDVPAGEGKTIPLKITLLMDKDENLITLYLERTGNEKDQLLSFDPVLILRPDIEDRKAHNLTRAYSGPEHKWPGQVTPIDKGFQFQSETGRIFAIQSNSAVFCRQDEWEYMIPQPFETERGMEDCTDIFSPGYFSLPLKCNHKASFKIGLLESISKKAEEKIPDIPSYRTIEEVMLESMDLFIVNRDNLKTVLAGYPWFLDWGRDTLICLRGIIESGKIDLSTQILKNFASFEKEGTLPNMIRGNDDSNRDTSDAPLWFFVACSDLINKTGSKDLLKLSCNGRSIKNVLLSIAENYIKGTKNGIKMDEKTSLIFSPSHFTWMDTNHPAGTPREGFPVEIQALWFFACSFLSEIEPSNQKWSRLKNKIQESVFKYYKQSKIINGEPVEFLSDCLHCHFNESAQKAKPDDAIRPNQLMAITLGMIDDKKYCKKILNSCSSLIIPGGIRSLADNSVDFSMPVYHNGSLLNDPHNPYQGYYGGDEDFNRKPAYHNGTAWGWQFPLYSEAILHIYQRDGVVDARNYLKSILDELNHGAIGHLSEIYDGNSPHFQKGCGAQAWSVTEWYRVWKKSFFFG